MGVDKLWDEVGYYSQSVVLFRVALQNRGSGLDVVLLAFDVSGTHDRADRRAKFGKGTLSHEVDTSCLCVCMLSIFSDEEISDCMCRRHDRFLFLYVSSC